ncbi:hypothetical protein M413DRAFT_69792 [Hebeloma cylindrosporum]|uniref:Fe2OG dioxygenase domain-containing protein n=1 Tax=Hebeloma cylindrosporum TaxID=76867 RepID=A0A0C3C1Y6_HEBCY|nr:hypothetical protein M413DRAFT_69792 [Hebeloma cylindrosporum h7]
MIDVISSTEPQLAALAAACQPASFGLAKEDVVDESYRKAGKMDASEFATQFSPTTSGIMENIRQALFGRRTTDSIKVELYKLNVYGPGSFFKPHVDTPRSESMVGSLVVVLPTKHEGGSLLFRHEGQEFSFDSANAMALDKNGVPQAPFVAFYSDVEHEVSVVNSGYRVTLTYNLHLVKPNSSIATEPAPSAAYEAGIKEICEKLKGPLSSFLTTPTFLPNGGYLGFGLVYKYPFSTNTNLSDLEECLKGADMAFAQVCEDLNLSFELKAMYDADEDSPNIWALVDEFPTFPGALADEDQNGILDFLKDGDYNPQIVFDSTELKSCEEHPGAQPIFWVREPTGKNKFETAYIHYGNEASLNYAYGDLCLVAHVLISKRRI